MGDFAKEAKEVEALSKALARHLVGRSVQVQGAALADLLAIWLAGHVNRAYISVARSRR